MKKYLLSFILPLLALGVFTSCEDIPAPYYVLNPEDAEKVTIKGEGTYMAPYTVQDALAIINQGTYTSDNVYVIGIVTRVEEIGGQYGNATYYITDEEYLDEDGAADPERQLEVYRGFGLNGDRFSSEEDLQTGDHVVVYGKLTMYGSTAEITQGSMLCAHNGVDVGPYEAKGDPEGSGTWDDPYNVIAAQKLIQDGPPSEKVYVHGKVSKIDEIGGQYGNATYYISDDGKPAGQLEVYRGLGLGGANFTGDGDLEVGDEVIVYGQLVLYSGNTPEITQGSYLIFRNGQYIDRPAEPSGSGTLEDPYNAAAANQLAESLSAGAKSDNVYIKGKVSYIKENYDGGHGNGTFYISEKGSRSGDEFYIYRANYFGNTTWSQGPVPNVGDDVVIYGKITKYSSQYGVTLETQQYEAYLYELNGDNGGYTPQPDPDPTGSGTLEDPYNAAAAIQICEKLGSGQNTEPVYIKGKVSTIKENYDGGHGNGTFYISEDGSTNCQFYIFRALYLGNVDYTSGTLPKQGDDVIIYGKLTNYQGNTPETVQKEAYLYSLNGNTGNEPPGPVGPTEGNGDGTLDSPYDVTATQSLYTNNDGQASKAYVKGYIVGYVNGNKMDASTCDFGYPSAAQTEILIADSPQESDYTKCIPVQLKKDSDFQMGLDLYYNQTNLGAEVVLLGSIEKYFGVCGIKSLEWAQVNDMTGDVRTIGDTSGTNKRRINLR